MASAVAVARFAGVSSRGSPTPRRPLGGRPGSSSSWRAHAAEEERAASFENGGASERPRPLVAILWDLDNVSPGVDPECARITARRLRDAASRLGGGALGGTSAVNGEDVAGPADVVAFLGFANDATLARVSARALRDEGVDVRRAESTPDAADMDLGAHVQGFARAWAASGARGAMRVSEPPPFVTPRALAAARDAAAASTRAAARPRAGAPAATAAEETLARAAAEAERAAFERFATATFAPRVDSAAVAKFPKAALFVVTSDNDVAPALAFARRTCGCFVVTCGDFVPKARLEGGGAQASKRRRAAVRRFGGVAGKGATSNKDAGATPQYWSFLQAAADRRPVGRLKLAAASDAALVWDPTRPFEVDGEGRGDATRERVAGGVVGVWRSRGARRGIGRWPSPRPAIPNEDEREDDERS